MIDRANTAPTMKVGVNLRPPVQLARHLVDDDALALGVFGEPAEGHRRHHYRRGVELGRDPPAVLAESLTQKA